VRVDYAEARRRATDLGLVAASETGEETPEPLVRRIARAAGIGTAVGLYAGLLIGVAEASYLLVLGKVVEEAQVFWAAPLGYGLLFASAGLFGGAAIGCLPLPRAVMERWLPAVGFVACLVPYLLAAVVFLLRRDLFAEKLPPIPLLGGVAAAHALLAVGLLAGIRLLASTRARGALGIRAAVPVFLVAIALGGALGARFGPAAPALEPPRPIASLLADRPNVLLVIVDTLRADALRLYADSGLRTPALERLAEEGTVYRAAFSQASWTKPSIATILTSLYPSSHMATLKPSRLPDSIVTLAEAFRGYGYTTGGIVTNINLAPSFNFHQGFDEYRYLVPDYLFGAEDSSSRLLLYEIARRIAGRLGGGVRPGQAYQPAEVVNEAARAWLDRHGAERFFLLLHYMEPHDPYFAHPDDGRAISRATTPDPDPALRDEMLRRYRSEIEYFDLRFGELLEDLERRGLYDELLVVVTSDHGEEFLDHEGWWHGLTLYDEQIGVPLVAKWPASARPDGARRDGQVRSIDIAPTVLSFVGAPVPPAMQGESLLDGPTRERVVYAEEDHEGNVLQAIRREGLKLIRANPGNPRGLADLELYDVAADPRETRNVLEREHARAEGLLEEMVELGLAAQAHGATAQTADITPEECERLRALGYVGESP
jgi:arylsulfatase A-like enzyme